MFILDVIKELLKLGPVGWGILLIVIAIPIGLFYVVAEQIKTSKDTDKKQVSSQNEKNKIESSSTEINKKTKHSPVFKGIILVVSIIFLIIIIPGIVHQCSSTPDNKATTTQVSQQNKAVIPAESANKTNTKQNTWNRIEDAQCQLSMSNASITISKPEPNNKTTKAVVEIQLEQLDQHLVFVHISFDGNAQIKQKVDMSGEKSFKINADKSFIKKMQKSLKMTVVIPGKTGYNQSVEFSLVGFSKACEWAK